MDKYIDKIKQITLAALDGEKVKIILFGSRARGDHNLASDVDIGVISPEGMDARKLTILRNRLEEENIPYKVEIVNFAETSADFKKEALRGAIVWKDWN